MMEEVDAYALLLAGRSRLTAGDPEGAAALLERANTEQPGKGSILESLGVAYYRLFRYQEAARCFGDALEADPTNDYAHYCLGLCFLKTGQRERAGGHFKMAWSLKPVEEYREKAIRFGIADGARG